MSLNNISKSWSQTITYIDCIREWRI